MALHMPRRSVTRFFVPLIDVLILLFCIFLLMEFNTKSELDQQSIDAENQSAQAKVTEEALVSRTRELQESQEILQNIKLNPDAADFEKARLEIEKLKKEIERLKSIKLQDRAAFRVIDIDPANGKISFFDENNPREPLRITDAKSAQALIAKHQKEAGSREVYYYFMEPRNPQGWPTNGQRRDYRAWFAKAANSLAESR